MMRTQSEAAIEMIAEILESGEVKQEQEQDGSETG